MIKVCKTVYSWIIFMIYMCIWLWILGRRHGWIEWMFHTFVSFGLFQVWYLHLVIFFHEWCQLWIYFLELALNRFEITLVCMLHENDRGIFSWLSCFGQINLPCIYPILTPSEPICLFFVLSSLQALSEKPCFTLP